MSSNVFSVSSDEFSQIPGSPIVYWLSDAMRKTFTMGKPLEEVAKPRVGLQTGNNDRFIREWWEVSQSRSSFDCKSREEAATNGKRWFPYNKGGEFRKWYGNQEYVVNWESDGKEIDDFRPRSVVRNPLLHFRESISWSKIGSGDSAFRFFPSGFAFADAGLSIFSDIETLNRVLAYANSSVAHTELTAIAPTLNFEVGQISALPIISELEKLDDGITELLIRMSQFDWNSYETSWDFVTLQILGETDFQIALQAAFPIGEIEDVPNNKSLNVVIPAYVEQCKHIAEEQRQREIKNNELVADAYGVCDEVPCDVPIERVSLKRNPAFVYPKNTPAERDELMT